MTDRRIPIKVLAVDGGGVRGLVPAVILAEIERRTGRRCAELFDIMAGTSTGSIVVLGLATPRSPNGSTPKFSAKDLANLYEQRSSDIFHRNLGRFIKAGGQLFNEKYSADGLDNVLEEYFGDALLADALTQVLVPAYDIEDCKPYIFDSRREDAVRHRLLMRDAARASCAAPTYFAYKKLSLPDELDSDQVLIDGGIFANSPGMYAYLEARQRGPEPECVIVSIGTGLRQQPLLASKAKDAGVTTWLSRWLEVSFQSVSQAVHFQLKQLVGRKNYYRLERPLLTPVALDETSPDMLKLLKKHALALLDEQDRIIDEVCERLTRDFA